MGIIIPEASFSNYNWKVITCIHSTYHKYFVDKHDIFFFVVFQFRNNACSRLPKKKPTDEVRVCDNCFIRYKRAQPAAAILWTYFDQDSCLFQHLDASVNDRLESHYMWSRVFKWENEDDS